MNNFFAFFGSRKRDRARMPLNGSKRKQSALDDHQALKTFAGNQMKFKLKNPSPHEKVYDVENGKEVGKGSFGTVYQRTHIRTGEERAVKEIIKDRVAASESDELYKEWRANLELEIQILHKLRHANVIHFYEYFESPGKILLVTDLCLAGDLYTEVAERLPMNGRKVSVIIRQLLSALAFCHAQGIVHRDIKPENIALETIEDFDRIKLIDFGHATYFRDEEGNKRELSQRVGTPYYVAPEVLRKKYDEKCDVWSLGVVSYILSVGIPPFNGESNGEIMSRILNKEPNFTRKRWAYADINCARLVKSMLEKDFTNRPAAMDLLDAPFLAKAKLYIERKHIDTEDEDPDADVAPFPQKVLENMKGFSTRQKLRQVVLSYVVSQLLPKSMRENMADLFRKFDADGDGVLDEEEIQRAFEEADGRKVKIEDMARIFKEIDQDRDGRVDYQEFMVAATEMGEVLSPRHLDAVFDVFDADGNGYIDAAELRGLFGYKAVVSDELIDKMIAEADTDNDGRVSKAEFIEMLTEKVKEE